MVAIEHSRTLHYDLDYAAFLPSGIEALRDPPPTIEVGTVVMVMMVSNGVS